MIVSLVSKNTFRLFRIVAITRDEEEIITTAVRRDVTITTTWSGYSVKVADSIIIDQLTKLSKLSVLGFSIVHRNANTYVKINVKITVMVT